MDEQCPFFDDANLHALRSDDPSEPYFLYLIREISRNPDKNQFSPPFLRHAMPLEPCPPPPSPGQYPSQNQWSTDFYMQSSTWLATDWLGPLTL